MRWYFYVYRTTLFVINKNNINNNTLPWSDGVYLYPQSRLWDIFPSRPVIFILFTFVKLFAYQLMFSTTIMLTDVLDVDSIFFLNIR